MLGRTGDYLNSALMALASARHWFAQTDTAFADNITRYYEQVRDQDLLCTHTLIPPQANRAQPGSQQAGGALMAHITNEDDNGIVVRGARMLATIGPFADELLVFPSTVLRGTPEDKPYSFAFAIPTDAPRPQVHRQGAVRLRPQRTSTTRSAPASTSPTRWWSSTTCTSPTSAASRSATPRSATASTPKRTPSTT